MEFRLVITDTNSGPCVTLQVRNGDDTYHILNQKLPPPAWKRGDTCEYVTNMEIQLAECDARQ